MITSLTLQSFRSYQNKIYAFPPGVTNIVGVNAAGKTNILEAIMMLASGRSFRAGVEPDVIRWGSELARISADTEETKLELVITAGVVSGRTAPGKKYSVNGIPRRMVDFVGHMPAVLFWPEDLEIVTDSPSRRRKYLDTVLMQADREYRRNILSYERGLRQRNKLLELIRDGKAHRGQLLFWDQLLIKTGGDITEKRAMYIDFVNKTTIRGHTFLVRYDKSIISESRLAHYAAEEIVAKSTLVGPHRDDFGIVNSEGQNSNAEALRDLAAFGSRGEQRLAVLWLKRAELSFAKKVSGVRPILLLDDIFSELDERHRKLVGEIVREQQTIITSADIDSIPEDLREDGRLLRL